MPFYIYAYAIGLFAFANTGLTSFTFPETTKDGGVYNVEAKLFSGCEALAAIHISAAVTSVQGMFTDCHSVTTITVAEDNPNFKMSSDFGDNKPLVYNKTGDGQITTVRFAFGDLGDSFAIPEGITEIGANAFEGHIEVGEIIIPASVTTIGEYAFAGCTGLTTLTFEGASALTSMGQYAFQNCSSLNNVVLPDTLTSIPQYAFSGCTGLEQITFGANTDFIGGFAFENCGLVSVSIPAGVTELGKLYKQTNARVNNVWVYTYYGDIFKDCTSLKTVTFEGPITKIGYEVFLNCTALESITIPDTVTNIANYAFKGSGLKSIELPANIVLGANNTTNGTETPTSDATSATAGHGYVFQNCLDLKKVTFTGAVKYLPSYMFSGCASLDTLEFVQDDGSKITNAIPASLKLLGQRAFEGTAFTSFDLSTVPAKVSSNYLFNNCVELEEIILPTSGLTSLGTYMFYGCTALKNVAYYDEDGEKVDHEIPFAIYAIGNCAFQNCVSLRTLKLSDQTTQLSMGAFRYCENLETLHVPNTVSSFASYIFDGCKNYTADNGTFYIPTSLKSITTSHLYILQGCEKIDTIVVHSGMTSLGETYFATNGYVNSGALFFANVPNLRNILIPENLDYYVDENGFLFKGSVLLLALPGRVSGEVEIPEYTTEIGPSAFLGNKNITKVYLNEGLKCINKYAFQDCVNLTGDIVFPSTMTVLGTGAFQNTAITSVVVPEYISEPGINLALHKLTNYAFADCTQLTSVVLGEGLETISTCAFQNCTNISSIVIPKTVKTMTGAFYYWTAEQTIYFEATELEAPQKWNTNNYCEAQLVYGYGQD